MIAVTGASGQLGRLVIQHLLTRIPASEIVALVRNPDAVADLAATGVTIRAADYDQPESYEAALEDVDKLLLISSSAVGQRVAQHKNVIEAAKKAGVKLLAYTSILKTPDSPMILAAEHAITEELIAQSGVPAVLLRNGWYLENYLMNLPAILEHKVIFGSARDGKTSPALRTDYAEATANILTSTDNQAGKIYELSGDQSFSLSELASTIAKATGETITYQDMSEEDYAKLLIEVGLPEGFAKALADSSTATAHGWLEGKTSDLSDLLGRPTIALSNALQTSLENL